MRHLGGQRRLSVSGLINRVLRGDGPGCFPKVLKITEDAHPKIMSTFGGR